MTNKPEYFQAGNALDVEDSMDLPIGTASITDGQLYTYGMISADPETGEPIQGDVKLETKQVMDNLELILDKAGCGFRDLVMVRIFLNDINHDFDAFNEVYSSYFDEFPPRYCIGVDIALGFKVEVHMIAEIPK